MEQSQKDKKPLPEIQCPACKHKEARVLRIGIREDPDWPVFICKNCRVQFIEPRFTDIQEYYANEYRKKHDSAPDQAWTAEQRYEFQYHFGRYIKKYMGDHIPLGGSLLDVGCSAGGLLGVLQSDYDVHGLEWNPEDVEFLKAHHIPVEMGSLDDAFPGQTFNVVTAIQVMEHQPDPVAFIQSCKKKLIGGGYLYIEVPHNDDALVSVYGQEEYSNFYYREPHITYWNGSNLATFLAHMGFETHSIWTQRYGLYDHLHWVFKGEPVADPYAARLPWKPIPKNHPQSAAFNRFFVEMDAEYRILLEGLECSDTLRAVARWREI
jgi:SAM-dependent methyltransferase